MKFVFHFLGKTREKYLDEAVRDYAQRLQRYLPVELDVIKEKHSKKSPDKTVMANDAALLLERSQSASLRVALDPGGRALDSEGLATLVAGWEQSGVRSVSFLIGGHLGLDPAILQKADLALSLSKMTFTHEMTRFILLEQLYRACSIKAGHNYHI